MVFKSQEIDLKMMSEMSQPKEIGLKSETTDKSILKI
jgi:hypothetical protein